MIIKDLVSILIPTYNRPVLFEQTLLSALAQTYSHVEILVNDNSTNEDTALLMKKYEGNPRVHYFRNREAKCKADNFRPFEQQARGEYLQWCMDDDILLPDKLSIMVQVLRDNDEVTLVSSQRAFIDEKGQQILAGCQTVLSGDVPWCCYKGREAGRFMLANCSNFIGEPSAVLFRRQDLVNHYWEADCRGYKTISDVAMWLELLEKGDLVLFREPLSCYRRHGSQEGQQPEVILLSRLEWLQLAGEYYQRGIFLDAEGYKQTKEQLWQDYLQLGRNSYVQQARNYQQYVEIMELMHENKSLCSMKKDKWYSEMEKLRDLVDARQYEAADKLRHELNQAIYGVAGLTSAEKGDFVRELAEIAAVLVIESGINDNMDKAIADIKQYDDNPYCAFLLARLYWHDNKHLLAMTTLEEKFQISWLEDTVQIGALAFWNKAVPAVQGLILNLLGQCCKFLGLHQRACACYLQAVDTYDAVSTKRENYSNYLFNSHYVFLSKEEYLLRHLGYDSLFQSVSRLHHNRKQIQRRFRSRKKIRIGYLSPDLRYHVVLLFIWAMLTKYNRDDFEVYCFSMSPVEDEYSEYLRQNTDCWCNIHHLTSQQAAKIIRQQEIDILVELAGHSKNNGLSILAHKPAPVQVCGIGYFATTGLKAVDYFLTDRHLVHEDTAKYFVENLLVLPHSHFCYVPMKDMPEPRQAPCRKNGYVTFGSFNNASKLNDVVLETWAAILRQVPASRLLLKADLFDDADGRALITAKLAALGIEEERFELRGFSFNYLPEYYDMDIALDTFPYPGGGTTCDALYMGVPVVTLGDGSHGGDFGISLLQNIGLDIACAFSVAEYIEKAKLLAGDFELLDALHLGLRKMMEDSPLMDQAAYMRDLEVGYKEIWQAYLG